MAFLELVWDVFYEDCLILFPILFLTFFFIEYLEHRAGQTFLDRVERAQKTGPLWGALIGLVPQCGFSVSCAHLFNGGIVTAGTLIAVFLSTSDEALPVLLSHRSALPVIWKLLLVKVLLAIVAGYVADFIWTREKQHQSFAKKNIEHECHIQESSMGELLRESFKRTLEVWAALFVVSIVLTFVMEHVPKESIQRFLLQGAFQPFLAALFGFIPNCAVSVVLVELYLSDLISFGAVVAGLSSAAGLGILALLRGTRGVKTYSAILAACYMAASL
ncbi:MAG: arsenic efflux protein, partial [Clostridia bacterium]|nr:arsenic efflux protein [Clostridia bacterium]